MRARVRGDGTSEGSPDDAGEREASSDDAGDRQASGDDVSVGGETS